MKTALAWLAFALLAGFALPAPAQVPVPKFEALVTDLTGTLTAQQQAALGAAGTADLGAKSTLGGSAIAFSFSTVKLGFSL